MGNLLSKIFRAGTRPIVPKASNPVIKKKIPNDEYVLGPAFRDVLPSVPKASNPVIKKKIPNDEYVLGPAFRDVLPSVPKASNPVIKKKIPNDEYVLGPAFRDVSPSPTSRFNSPPVEFQMPLTRTSSRFADYGAKARNLGRSVLTHLDPRGSKWKWGLYGAAGLSFPASAFSDIVNSDNEYDAMAEGIDDTFGTWFGSGTYDSARNLSGQSPADDSSLVRIMGLGEVYGRLPKLADGIASIPKAIMNPRRTFRNARGYAKGLTGAYNQQDINNALQSRQHIQGVYNKPQDAILEAADTELRNGGTYRGAMSGMVRDQNLVSNALGKLNVGLPLSDIERKALADRGYNVPEDYNNKTRLAQTRR